MNQEIVDERRENQQAKIWQKKVNFLLRLDSELFTSKSSSIRKRAVVTSAQQTKLWNREINDLLRLGSELFTSSTSMILTASSRQKKKKQLIVKLRVRQLKQKQKQKQLIVKLRVRQQKQKQKQKQEQKQRNNEISTNDQSERGMRIRRAPKRFY